VSHWHLTKCWILWKAFSESIEMIMWFLSLLLFICCITFNDLCMLTPYSPCLSLASFWQCLFALMYSFQLYHLNLPLSSHGFPLTCLFSYYLIIRTPHILDKGQP
jgi:hypothetical protein